MLIERKPFRVEPEAFIHLERRHPLRDVPVDGKRQTQEIIHMLFVVEVELDDVHINCRGEAMLRPYMFYIDLARSAICERRL